MGHPPPPAHQRRPRRRRRVLAILGGALLLAVVLAGIAWLALDDPVAQVAGSEYEAVALAPDTVAEPDPGDLELEPFDGDDFSVLRPASWTEERLDHEAREDAYDLRFVDPREAHGFRLTYMRADVSEEPPEALNVLESVEESRSEELPDYEQVRLEEAEPHALAGSPQAALAESTYTVTELERLVGGWEQGERFRVQYLISDGFRLHSLVLVGPAPLRESHAGLIEEIFASFEVVG